MPGPRLSHRFRQQVRLGLVGVLSASGLSRAQGLPGFIIAGAMKAGTTSLYRYLERHPRIVPAMTKEVHFFDWHYPRGLGWYRASFPPRWKLADGRITGESSPYYIFHPAVPQRIHRHLPDVKLIFLLRDPVTRAVSHYFHSRNKTATETLPIAEALDAEADRLAGETDRLLADEACVSHPHVHFSYQARGRYLEQLKRYEALFGRDRMLVLKAEDLFERTAEILPTTWAFLDLGEGPLPQGRKRRNPGVYKGQAVSDAVFQRLMETFDQPNRELYDYLGRDMGWLKPGDPPPQRVS